MKARRQNGHGTGLTFRPVVRYIVWFYVAVLLVELVVASTYNISSMKREADFVVASAQRQVETRVSHTITLLNTLTGAPFFRNPAVSYPEKAVALNRYCASFGYLMMSIVDKDINVWDKNGIAANLGGRPYMQRLFATGKPQVTDSFAAGFDGATLNYTVAVPILVDGQVEGCIFAAIYFDELSTILRVNLYDSYQSLYLFGGENQAMSTPGESQYGKPYLELVQHDTFLGQTAKQVEEHMLNRQDGSYWYISNGNLYYSAYAPIANTSWTLFCTPNFWGAFQQFLPPLIGTFLLSTLICLFLVLLANKYIRTQMGTVNILLSSVQDLEQKIYQNQKPDHVDFNEIISLTSKGLTDGLTGVITRSVFLNQVPNKIKALAPNTLAVICFVDVDNLKIINDTYGHKIGDMALKTVGYVLREYEKKYSGLVGRYGGDEFILLLMGFSSRERLYDVLDELTQRLHAHINAGSATVPVQCSLGVALCTTPDADAETLIGQADKMLYAVKARKKGQYQVFQ